MFGFGGEFIYFQCGRCGCLQTKAVPADLSRYYPPHYYSFHLQAVPQRGLKARLAGWLARLLGAERKGRGCLVCQEGVEALAFGGGGEHAHGQRTVGVWGAGLDRVGFIPVHRALGSVKG